jgi:dTDP-4-amino-4,6-dideoxygalactose transaminase
MVDIKNHSNIIPFNKLSFIGNELEYIQEVICESHTSGDGKFSDKCISLIEDEIKIYKALLTTSCTHALEVSAILLNINPDDEVIVPSFTFVSTINAFVLRGVKPVFIDIRPDTLNMDENQLEALITNKTKAIIPVHYAGVGCEMDMIMRIANNYEPSLLDRIDKDLSLNGAYQIVKEKYLSNKTKSKSSFKSTFKKILSKYQPNISKSSFAFCNSYSSSYSSS